MPNASVGKHEGPLDSVSEGQESANGSDATEQGAKSPKNTKRVKKAPAKKEKQVFQAEPNLASAIAKAQIELTDLVASAINPFHESKYVKLGSLLEHIRPIFAKHGVAVYHKLKPFYEETLTVESVNGNKKSTNVKTINGHIITIVLSYGKTGEKEESKMHVKNVDNPQQLGGLITYLRRYTLQSVAGVGTDGDDDGETAMGEAGRGAFNGQKKSGQKGVSGAKEALISPDDDVPPF